MKRFLITCLLPIFLIATGCGEEKVEQPQPPMVKTILASQAGKVIADTYPGVVKGRYESNLAFQTGGRILTRNVQKGSLVFAGEILMTIDNSDAVQQVKSAEAQVAQAQNQLTLAQSNLDRYTQLYSEDAIPASTLDQYTTNYQNAVAAYNSAVAQAQQYKNNLGYTNLIANSNGVISNVLAEIGQVVSAGQTVLTLVQADEMEVEIDVPENHLADVAVGKTADVTFWAVNENVQGVVREISPMADETSRTYRVRLSLQNPSPIIQLGMTAEVILHSIEVAPDSVILPLSAIYQTDNKTQVWIVTQDNKAALKTVRVENFSGNEVKVKGLSPNDRVITAGVHKLREGQEIRINP